MKSGVFFPKKSFVFWWGLRPRPRPWAGPCLSNLELYFRTSLSLSCIWGS